MDKELIGILGFSIVTASILPYAWRILTKRAHTSITGWAISTLTGFVVFLTYGGIGAKENIWIALIELVDPLVIMVVAMVGRNLWEHFDFHDRIALAIALVALVIHVFSDRSGHAQIAYTCAIIADMCGAWAVVRFAWKHPEQEQPLAWSLSIVGILISFFSIPIVTVGQLSLPIYQLIFSLLILYPALRYHVQKRIPLRQWM